MFSNDIFEISVQDDVGIIIVIEYLYVKEARLDSQNVWQVFGLANSLQIRDLEQTCMEWIVNDLSNQEIKDINEWFNLLLLAIKYNINLEFIDNMITAASCESIEIQDFKKSMYSTSSSFGRYLFISKLLKYSDIPGEVLNHIVSSISLGEWKEEELHFAMRENIIPKNDLLIAIGKINIDEEDKNATIKASSKWVLFDKEVDRTGSAETLPDTWFAQKQPVLYQPEPKRLQKPNTFLDSFEIQEKSTVVNNEDLKTVDNDRSLQELYNKLERLATISPTNSFHEGKSYSDFSGDNYQSMDADEYQSFISFQDTQILPPFDLQDEHTSDYITIKRYGSVKRYNDDSTVLSEQNYEKEQPYQPPTIINTNHSSTDKIGQTPTVPDKPNPSFQSVNTSNLYHQNVNPRYQSIPREYYHDPQSTPKPHIRYYTEPRSYPTRPLPAIPNNVRLPPKRKPCVDLEKQEVKCFKKKGFTDMFKGFF
ncbi:hypothetical protein HK103_004548 [Boothiomyces macroporosus]|uniref:BTB domain-containing protein n=1 Tax=Boothiomyces macroporosus TaxID=261099 RepID=A0AAD5UH32_9FUNG|nr:hypothetical protein HK103_004548 [Boothiomyces macroporosus]